MKKVYNNYITFSVFDLDRNLKSITVNLEIWKRNRLEIAMVKYSDSSIADIYIYNKDLWLKVQDMGYNPYRRFITYSSKITEVIFYDNNVFEPDYKEVSIYDFSKLVGENYDKNLDDYRNYFDLCGELYNYITEETDYDIDDLTGIVKSFVKKYLPEGEEVNTHAVLNEFKKSGEWSRLKLLTNYGIDSKSDTKDVNTALELVMDMFTYNKNGVTILRHIAANSDNPFVRNTMTKLNPNSYYTIIGSVDDDYNVKVIAVIEE